MIGAISPYSAASGFDFAAYAASRSRSRAAASPQEIDDITRARRADRPQTPVRPVKELGPVTSRPSENAVSPQERQSSALPSVREGVDAAEMAARMRIEYLSEDQVKALSMDAQNTLPGRSEDAIFPIVDPMAITREAVTALQPGGQETEEAAAASLPGQETELAAASALPGQEVEKAGESKSAQEVMSEEECQTCANRKYQDGSDDPGVSFKMPTQIAPEQAATAVRGHEMEHVVREQAAAQREGREVVSQSVTIHQDICPECGDVYVSGGTTRTTTAGKSEPQQQAALQQQEQERRPFAAIA